MSKEDLLELAEKGDEISQFHVVQGYSHGMFGFKKDSEELFKLAEKNWPGIYDKVILGYIMGDFRFEECRDKIEKLVREGSSMAKWIFEMETFSESGQI